MGSGENVDGTRAHKDLTDQYAEQLREDVKYRRKWCEKIGLSFVLPTNVSQLSQPKPAVIASSASERVDLNHRPHGPEL